MATPHKDHLLDLCGIALSFRVFFYGSLLFGGQNDFYVLVNGRGEASAVLFCGAYHFMNFSPPHMKNAPDKPKKWGKVAGKLREKQAFRRHGGVKFIISGKINIWVCCCVLAIYLVIGAVLLLAEGSLLVKSAQKHAEKFLNIQRR